MSHLHFTTDLRYFRQIVVETLLAYTNKAKKAKLDAKLLLGNMKEMLRRFASAKREKLPKTWLQTLNCLN